MQVVLYQPQIPPNTGNISRLCVGTNTPLHLIRPLGFSIDDRYLRRAGLDYWKDAQITCHDSLEALYAQAPSSRFLYFTTKSTKPYTQIQFQETDYLVFGPETSGLPASILGPNQDRAYTIPMFGPIRSLNLSTAVGIVLYEALRQVNAF